MGDRKKCVVNCTVKQIKWLYYIIEIAEFENVIVECVECCIFFIMVL